jgi:hypothetical protein
MRAASAKLGRAQGADDSLRVTLNYGDAGTDGDLRAAAALLRPSVQQELEESIAAEPERHPLIPGTGGFCKARWRYCPFWWRYCGIQVSFPALSGNTGSQ